MNIDEVPLKEYEIAIEQFRHFSLLRRQDLMFVVIVQGAVLTIMSSRFTEMAPVDVSLSVVAFLVTLLGLNSDRRLTEYMVGNAKRAKELEQQLGMKVFSGAHSEVANKRFLYSNKHVFFCFYTLLAVSWIIVWAVNLLT